MKHTIADLLDLAADALEWLAYRCEDSGLCRWLDTLGFVDRNAESHLVVGVYLGVWGYALDWRRDKGLAFRRFRA